MESRLSVREEFEILIQENRIIRLELVWWMFLFWIGNIGATIGIVLVFLKK